MRDTLVVAHHHAVRQHHASAEHAADEREDVAVDHALRERRHQPLVRHPIEELLQIEVHHELVPIFHVLPRLRERRVAAPTLAESVTARVERRLVQWIDLPPYSFLHLSLIHI